MNTVEQLFGLFSSLMGKISKVIVCGQAAVGKTAILEQIVNGDHVVGSVSLMYIHSFVSVQSRLMNLMLRRKAKQHDNTDYNDRDDTSVKSCIVYLFSANVFNNRRHLCRSGRH